MDNYNNEISVSNYFDIHNFYKKKLGDKVIILMQVGSFVMNVMLQMNVVQTFIK